MPENPRMPAVLPAPAVSRRADRTLSTAAAGDADPSFAPNLTTYPGQIRATAFQSDGKMVAGGFFKRINGEEHFNLARFNTDGSLDSGFAPKVGDRVYAVAVQPDGKIVIGGNFFKVNGAGRNHIARLNADGSLDTTFNPGAGPDGVVYAVAVQTDGKILIGGTFAAYNGSPSYRYIRLNADGTQDFNFNANLDDNGYIYAITLQPDGKILAGGFFSKNNASNGYYKFARFNTDGSLDSGFVQISSSETTAVLAIERQPNGKIYLGGTFATYGGLTRTRLARLNADGSVDTTFTNAVGANNTVNAITFNSATGKIIIGGAFTSYGNAPRARIAQLNIDGSVDASFNPGSGFDGTLYTAKLIPNTNQIFAGGNITTYNDQFNNLGVRLSSEGAPDAIYYTADAQGGGRVTITQSDGKILVGGPFTTVGGATRNNLARFNPDGTLDTAFNTGTGTNGLVYAMALQSDGKILIGGTFTLFNGVSRPYLARLNKDGSLDTGFSTFANSSVEGIAVQPDGRIIVTGAFSIFNQNSCYGIVRLNSDGTNDQSFAPVFTGYDYIEGIGIQTDGKIVVSGKFYGTPQFSVSVRRLNANGSTDSSFAAPSAVKGDVYALAIQPDGKILIGGDIIGLGPNNQNGFARLNANGSVDSTFNAGTGTAVGDDIEDIVVQPDGKILIGGSINSVNGVSRHNLARLSASGALDASFNPDVDNFVYDISLQTGNPQKIIIAGDFNTVGGAVRTGVARLNLNTSAIRPPADFDGDGRSDFSIFRPSNATWYFSNTTSGFSATPWGADGDKLVPADYDGDGRTDIGVYRNGYWYIIKSSNGGIIQTGFGTAEDIPVPADFDGDGKADISIYRPSNSTFYRLNSSDGAFAANSWGAVGDLPVIGDFDGDGRADLCVYRPTNGAWYRLNSSNNQFAADSFGAPGDLLVPADYDGDGKTDIAVYRPSNNVWYRLNSSNGSFAAVGWGAGTDKPVPADYDGDGKADVAVFRDGLWFIIRSSDGQIGYGSFGGAGDVPLASAYVR